MCNAGHVKTNLNVPKIYISFLLLTELMQYIAEHLVSSMSYIYHAFFLTVCALHLEMHKVKSTGNELQEDSVSCPQRCLS